MHIDIKSALAGAIAGGLITAIVGPIFVSEYQRHRRTSDWEGNWYTIVCENKAPTGFAYEVRWSQLGDHVAGPYVGSNERSEAVHGFFRGDAGVGSLEGTWARFGFDNAGGQFTFVLSDDKRSFHGEYDDRGREKQWAGGKDGYPSDCRPN